LAREASRRAPQAKSGCGDSGASRVLGAGFNLDALLKNLEADGIHIEGRQDGDYGRFAWVIDPEGHRIELWEPPQDAADGGAKR